MQSWLVSYCDIWLCGHDFLNNWSYTYELMARSFFILLKKELFFESVVYVKIKSSTFLFLILVVLF